MKRAYWIKLIVAVAALVTLSLAGCYQPPIKSEVENGKKAHKPGETVYLFHSGTQELKKLICVGETIPVYSEVYATGVTKRKEVGKVKVLEYAGEHQFKAQVVEGQVKAGNVALKENAGCLIYEPQPEE